MVTFADPIDGVPFTDADGLDARTAWLQARAAADAARANPEAVFGSGLFVPATTGDPFPPYVDEHGYKQGGLAFDFEQDEKAAIPLDADPAWEVVQVWALVYAENFGTGVVRFEGGGASTDETVDLEVVHAGAFMLWDNVQFQDATAFGLHRQIATMPLTRVTTDVEDNLAEDACVIRLFLKEG